ncbi:MAG: EAL domain-containing protein [Nitrosomonadales bacterium]|nr:EAL domain-containing protein [Nitrosomonadales bacterium]
MEQLSGQAKSWWLHPSHQAPMRTAVTAIALLTLGMTAAKVLPPLPGARGIAGYLPLHTLLETISIVISMLVFAVGWNAYRRGLPGNILLLACAFFGVGLLDFTHMLSFAGMPDFVTPSSVDKSIDFWFAARSLAAITLFTVAVTSWRLLPSVASRYVSLTIVMVIVASLHWLFLFHDDLIPKTFIPGKGLTPFKINYEYALVALNLITASALWVRMRKPLPFNAAWLFGAVCAMALSEFFFTLYSDVTDIYNLLGHVYKAISYLLIYRAVFVATVEHPYQQLNLSQTRLQATLDAIPDPLFEIGLDGRLHHYHASRTALLLEPAEGFPGKNLDEVFPPPAASTCRIALQEASELGRSDGKEIALPTTDGERWFELSVTSKHEGYGRDERYLFLLRDITGRKLAETELNEAHNFLKIVVDAVPMRIFWKDRQLRYLGCNPAFAHDAGVASPQDIVGKDDYQLGWKDQAEIYRADDRRIMESGVAKLAYEEPQTTPDGKTIWLRTSKVPLRNAHDEIIGVLGIYQDITGQKRVEEEVRIAATAFNTQESLMITDPNGVFLRVNHAFTETTGYTADEAIGQTPRILKSGRHDAAFYNAMWESIRRTGAWRGEVWDRRKNGEIYPKWLTISAVKGDDGAVTHYVGAHIDITERKAAEEEIKHLAFYDPLTQLPNRRLLMDRLQHAMATSGRSGREGALLFIDLDNFKTLNDTLGHSIGDLLLQQVAQRLQSCVRDGDTVARLSGDEFVVVLEGLSEQTTEASAQTETIGEKILAVLSQPYQLEAHEYHSTVSIGATLFNHQQQPMDDLLKQADIAMYQAKRTGRNALRFFDPQMQANITSRVSLEGELRKALERQQLHLHYQIQVDSENRPIGAEALIRRIHPERGFVSPAQFIPLAEETGLILSIGQWVVETACAQIKAWQQHAHSRDLALAVNVSARQFRQPDFVAQVQAAVQHHDIDPRLLKLELTEGMLLDNVENVIATMTALKAIGVRISLDDFGTGYSSLQYLKRLPLDQLKVDQSFVRDLTTDSSDKAIVRTIIAMAHSLDLDVIAEGVETVEQRDILLGTACTNFQGYLFGKPMPIDKFDELLERM